jgi:DNA-binding MarR family transcriptional regulator
VPTTAASALARTRATTSAATVAAARNEPDVVAHAPSIFAGRRTEKGLMGLTGTGLRAHLSYLLREAERQINRLLAAGLAAEGVSVEQWRILRALSDGHGHSMTDLAEAVLMPHPTLTKAVDRLVDDALVYRRQDAVDRRRVAVYLSNLGRGLVVRLDRRAAEHHADVEAAFGAERTERLMHELEALAAASKRHDARDRPEVHLRSTTVAPERQQIRVGGDARDAEQHQS